VKKQEVQCIPYSTYQHTTYTLVKQFKQTSQLNNILCTDNDNHELKKYKKNVNHEVLIHHKTKNKLNTTLTIFRK